MSIFKKIISAVMAVAVVSSLTACVGDQQPVNTPRETEPPTTEAATEAPTEPATKKDSMADVEAAADGPRLYVGDTTAKAGEMAEVTLYVENADMQWNMCGIHLTFPDVLEVDMMDVEQRLIKYSRGNASTYSTASVGMLWVNNLPEALTSQNLGSLFFTEVFDGDHGLDGDIVTFYLKVPEDAESGTVYPIGFFYLEGDKFINKNNDYSLQKYAFENWEAGSITVE